MIIRKPLSIKVQNIFVLHWFGVFPVCLCCSARNLYPLRCWVTILCLVARKNSSASWMDQVGYSPFLFNPCAPLKLMISSRSIRSKSLQKPVADYLFDVAIPDISACLKRFANTAPIYLIFTLTTSLRLKLQSEELLRSN